MYDAKFKPNPDPEMREFEEALLRSIDEANRGEYARVHTPEMIAGYKARMGRPTGAKQAAPVKVATTLRMQPEALTRWRASGKGWQTRAADLLAAHAPL